MLAVVIVSVNILTAHADYEGFDGDWALMEMNPEQVSQTISFLANYTGTIEENADWLKTELALIQDDGYLNKNESVITEASKLETEYIVQKGDTMSGIASKFNMHVATIVERNSVGVDGIEDLHPGQKLIIPPKDTSSSKDWLVALNDKKQKERAAAEKARQKALAASYRSTVYRDTSEYRGTTDGSWGNPINYTYISRGISRGHSGIDMVANTGTPVYASKSGKVNSMTSGFGSGYGLSILLDNGGGQTSRYAHMSRFAVGIGDYVEKGQVIGYSGNTGWSTGPHLHFEARQNGRVFNPF